LFYFKGPLIGSPRGRLGEHEMGFEEVLERQIIILQQALDGKVNDHKSCIQHFQQLSLYNFQTYKEAVAAKKSLEKVGSAM